jgi:alcohol dehydrogenase, propanol-preferring
MVLNRRAAGHLECVERTVPACGRDQVLLRVRACGVCRTDVHLVDGELPGVQPPVVPGHEVIGIVEQVGTDVTTLLAGQRAGVPWLGFSCGTCDYCGSGRENLCERAELTGYQRDGGYADYIAADARFVFAIPPDYTDLEAAPLMCAGLIGYRSYRMAGHGRRLGIYGFGAAAHIVAQVAVQDGREVYAFTSPGDLAAQAFARSLGARWAGASNEAAPEMLDAAIIFAPVGALVPEALLRVVRGGTVVCAGIHMSDIPTFPYRLLWGERTVRSVANLTRGDAEAFLSLASRFRITTHVVPYALDDANRALDDVRRGRVTGAAVLRVGLPMSVNGTSVQ